MDVSPLLYSLVDMAGDGVVETFHDDLAVRKKATLLPSGYYGAIFTNIRFKSAASNIRLNFTMTNIGGYDYHESVTTAETQRAAAFSRAGLGFHEFTPLSAETLWTIRPDNELTSEWEYRPVEGLYPSMYAGMEDNTLRVADAAEGSLPHNLSCR